MSRNSIQGECIIAHHTTNTHDQNPNGTDNAWAPRIPSYTHTKPNCRSQSPAINQQSVQPASTLLEGHDTWKYALTVPYSIGWHWPYHTKEAPAWFSGTHCHEWLNGWMWVNDNGWLSTCSLLPYTSILSSSPGTLPPLTNQLTTTPHICSQRVGLHYMAAG